MHSNEVAEKSKSVIPFSGNLHAVIFSLAYDLVITMFFPLVYDLVFILFFLNLVYDLVAGWSVPHARRG